MPSFKPKFWIVALTLLTIALFCRLGYWQLDRAEHKRVVAESLATVDSGFLPLVELEHLEAAEPYRHSAVSGVFLAEQQMLLDNQVLDGQAGYEVISPLRMADGRVILINRGWLAGRPGLLPTWETPNQAITLQGIIAPHSAAGMRMGEAVVGAADTESGWPKVVNYPSLEELEQLLNVPVYPYTLWLDKQAPHGFARDWQPKELSIEKHLGYAFQWFALALAVFVMFVVLNVKRNDR